ncbi:MAG TPA: DegT/DnrJ/EryC1/StrS family aminotransferase [Phycisphaerales bacterium]|nr:DegT/DnrJ/EryC1/StrS family aminotransferase [Phycisphaerales bacterium]
MISKVALPPVRTKDRFLIFGAPRIDEPEINEVISSMRSGWLGTGPKVAQFEKDFAAYRDMKYGVALYSCTAALHLSMLAAGLKPGDEVITTPLTFCATVNAIIHAGATPVLADVDPLTQCICPRSVESKLTSRTRALLPVHFAGRPCNMDALMPIVRSRNLTLIEDCAHAIETEYHSKPAGSFGDYGCFSFYVTKNIVTGEGGMVLTNNEDIAARIKMLGLHGMSRDAWKRFSDEGYKHYYVLEAGFKYNMMDLQAAIGVHQLQKVHAYWTRRQEVWNRYNEAFRDLPIGLPADPEPNTRHAYHLYTLMIDKNRCGISRDEFLSAMTANGIGVGVHYLSIPEHPYYQKTFNWKLEDTPNAVKLGRETVSIPLTPKLSDADVNDVITAVRRILGRD